MKEKNIHEGHRERALKSFLTKQDGTPDHVLLEMFLYPVVPRKDTNPIAHALLKYFNDLHGVFTASVPELTAVHGVGEKVARHIFLVGKLFEATNRSAKDKSADEKFGCVADIRDNIVKMFRGEKTEKLVVIFLGEKYNKLAFVEFNGSTEEKVSANMIELAQAILIHKPTFVVIAHNHPSGEIAPSIQDDMATKKINILCTVHGTKLIDHVIFSESEVYSYHTSGRLELIKEKANLESILSNIKE